MVECKLQQGLQLGLYFTVHLKAPFPVSLSEVCISYGHKLQFFRVWQIKEGAPWFGFEVLFSQVRVAD